MSRINKIRNRFKTFLEKTIKKRERLQLNSINKKNLVNDNFSIISSNCVGGIIYHDLGKKFLSPTINLYFEAKDFIKFLKNFDYYISLELEEDFNKKYNYPVAKLGDLKLYCVHYDSYKEVKSKWEERCKRINKDNLFVIMSERDFCSEVEIKEFDQLPYKNKIIFVSKPMPEIKSAYYIPGTENKKEKNQGIIPVMKYKSIISGRRFIDDFDYVSFLNNTMEKNK